MIKLLVFTIVSIWGLISLSNQDVENKKINDCVETDSVLNRSLQDTNDDHNCEYSDETIWTVKYKSNGEWECTSDGSVKCFPCISEPDDPENPGESEDPGGSP